MLSAFCNDLRYSARALARTPAFAAAAIATLALGIGANVALFSLFEQILVRTLPVSEPNRLVNLSSPGPKLDTTSGLSGASPTLSGDADTLFSYPMFRDLERVQGPFAGIAAHRLFNASLSTGERARLATATLVSGSYFPLLGLKPALGRLLGPADDRVDGQAESVVLSYAYWQSEFGGDPDVVGRRLTVNGTALAIAGVAPRSFDGTTVGARASVFVPITFALADLPEPHTNRGMHWVHLFARLAPGVTSAQAAAAITGPYRAVLSDVELPLWEARPQEVLDAFAARSILLEPGARGQSTLLVPLRGRLEWLLAASGAVLLLCCANVVGLLLIRGAARGGEMAVRASMGATRGRLAALLVAESVLLAVPAAAASLPIAVLILAGLASGVPGLPPAAFDVTLSVGAAAAAVIVAVVTALAAGLFPLRTLAGARAANVLQAYGGRQTPAKAVARFRAALATSQIALAMALLAITGLCAHSLANIARIDLGIAADSLVTFSLSPGTSGYTPEASASLARRLADELAAIPGVSSVASSSSPLLSGEERGMFIRRVDDAPVDDGLVSWNMVGPGFFRTVGIELLAGREFGEADTGRGLTVVIVNRRFAERYGVGVGSTVGFTPRGDRHEIVGIVADAKYGTVTGEVKPLLYNATLGRGAEGTYFVRGARSPEDLLATVRDTVKRLARDLPIAGLRTMEQQVADNTGTQRFLAAAATAFAVLATALAALGLYGVLAYSVTQRSREIALRVALGAPVSRIRGAVLRQVAAMAAVGVAVGLAAAVLLGRAARAVLFGVDSWDPIALAGAAAVLALVVLGAAYVPARRASRVDPMAVLRYE